VPLEIAATGRHSRQMCRTNACGFPDKAPKATSVVAGLRTGDIVRAIVPQPLIKAGSYVGRLAVRASGSCNITTHYGTVQGIHVRYCQPLHRADGYRYQFYQQQREQQHRPKAGVALPPRARRQGFPRGVFDET
jgi:hypothetical protein